MLSVLVLNTTDAIDAISLCEISIFVRFGALENALDGISVNILYDRIRVVNASAPTSPL